MESTTHEPPGPAKRSFADELHARAWPAFLAVPITRRILLILFAALIVWIDYLTSPSIRFPAFYVPPILLFAWYDGFGPGSWIGAAMVGARLVMELWIWPSVPWSFDHSLITAGTSIAMILVLTWFTARAGELTREVRLIWGLLPICIYCHRIRSEKNHWEKLERYISERTKAQFTHGICPHCLQEKNHDNTPSTAEAR